MRAITFIVPGILLAVLPLAAQSTGLQLISPAPATDFPNQINIAPREALDLPYELNFSTHSQVFPIAIPVPNTLVSPVPPPGVSGPDTDTGLSTTGLICLPFSIDGNTHIIVLQGNVQIAPAGGAAQTISVFHYAFVPPGYAIGLSNPAVYAGPAISN
jgi:hypothetical protein